MQPQPATWYLGPVGDLRPLICPETNVVRTVQRFGGVHQALSGARTMDVTGHRASWELTLPWLTPVESRFVEALHLRTVPGPFRLIDPLGTNRLPRDAAMLLPLGGAVFNSSGGVLRRGVGPADIGPPVSALEWSSYTAGSYLRLPVVPVLEAETVTFSLWLKAETASATGRLALDHIPAGATGHTSSATQAITITTGWSRYSVTATVPAGTGTTRPALVVDDTAGGTITAAASQVETGSAPTEWDLGGAAPPVLVDQVERVSPNYPRNDLTATLLEA